MPSDFSTSRSSGGSIGLAVIVPVYNEGATLGVALERVLALPVESLEAIVVDDGSTDRTPAIIAKAARADQRIRPFRLEQSAGKTTPAMPATGRIEVLMRHGRSTLPRSAELLVADSQCCRN